MRSRIPNLIKTSIQNPTRSEKTKTGNWNGAPFYTCMRRFGRMRWSIPVDAKGDARCCNPADWSHRAMTASPASPLAGPALCRDPPPAWSYSAAAAAAALLCCIWPPMWRCCARLCGANFQVSKKTTANAQNLNNLQIETLNQPKTTQRTTHEEAESQRPSRTSISLRGSRFRALESAKTDRNQWNRERLR